MRIVEVVFHMLSTPLTGYFRLKREINKTFENFSYACPVQILPRNGKIIMWKH